MHDYLPSFNFHRNGNLNFQTGSENFSPATIHSHSYNPSDIRTNHLIHENEDSKDGTSKKTVRDPQSHRIIEKRRRDRMNNCLADLSKLIPTSYFKKGRGRIEKTEIIEMAIKHIKHLETHNKVNCVDINRCELRLNEEEKKEEFRHGFRESISELMRFLVEMNGLLPSDVLCQSLVNHLGDHLAKIMPLSTCESVIPSGSTASVQQPCSSSSPSSSSCNPSIVTTKTTATVTANNTNNHIKQVGEIRERSASISSVMSEGTTRSGSTPAPCINKISSFSGHRNIENMKIESIDNCYLNKLEIGGSRLRDMLKSETNSGNADSDNLSAVSAMSGITTTNVITGSPFTPLSSYNYNSNLCSKPFDSTVEVINKNGNNVISGYPKKSSESNGLTRSNSVSPSAEHRFYKKGIKERFQLAMNQEFKRSSDSNTQPTNNCSNGFGQSPLNDNRTSLSNSRSYEGKHISSVGYHSNSQNINNLSSSSSSSCSTSSYFSTANLHNIGKVFKYKEKIINSIPAFALHPNGTFYIPLSINPQLISHWFTSSESEDLYSVLHPVNIPVNFNYLHKLNHLCPLETIEASPSYSHNENQQSNVRHQTGQSHLLLTAN